MTSISIVGPFAATGVSDTPSRQRIFVCEPTADGTDQACARQILTTLATRAYRRPVDDASLETLLGFYEQGRQLRGFEAGIQYALARVLVVQPLHGVHDADPIEHSGQLILMWTWSKWLAVAEPRSDMPRKPSPSRSIVQICRAQMMSKRSSS